MLSLKHREFKCNHLHSSDWLVLCFKQHFTSLAHVSIYLHNINLNPKNLYTITLHLNFRIISVKGFNDLFAPLAYRSRYLQNININIKNLNKIPLRIWFTHYLHQKLQKSFAIYGFICLSSIHQSFKCSLPNPVPITLQLDNYWRILKIPRIHRINEIKNIKKLTSTNPFDRPLCKSVKIPERKEQCSQLHKPNDQQMWNHAVV